MCMFCSNTMSLLVRFATRRPRGDQAKLSCAGVGTGERCMIASSLDWRPVGCLLATCTALCVLRSLHDGKDLIALEDFFLLQRLRQAFQGIAVLGQDAS